MERDINWYMNTARENTGITSDRKLARELNVGTAAHWRDPYRPNIPERDVMIRLADLAGIPHTVALLDRDIWVATFKAPETVPVYKEILKKFPKYAAALLIACLLYATDFDTGAMAKGNDTGISSPINSGKVYIMRILCFI